MALEDLTVLDAGRLRGAGKRERWGHWIPDQVRDDGEGVAPMNFKRETPGGTGSDPGQAGKDQL